MCTLHVLFRRVTSRTGYELAHFVSHLIFTSTCIRTCTHICTHICTHTHTHTHAHTHTHTHTLHCTATITQCTSPTTTVMPLSRPHQESDSRVTTALICLAVIVVLVHVVGGVVFAAIKVRKRARRRTETLPPWPRSIQV